MEVEVAECEPSAYVDDTAALAARPKDLNKALAFTKEYERLTDQTISAKKSVCFSACTPSMKRLKFGTVLLPRVSQVKAVGVTLDMQSGGACEQDSDRTGSAKDIARLM